MAIVYSSWENHSHLNLQILFSNTKNVIDQNGNRQSKSVKLKTYQECQSPNRNKIDYTCIKDNQNGSIYKSRSNGRMYAK